jgi:hypothetical protein
VSAMPAKALDRWFSQPAYWHILARAAREGGNEAVVVASGVKVAVVASSSSETAPHISRGWPLGAHRNWSGHVLPWARTFKPLALIADPETFRGLT